MIFKRNRSDDDARHFGEGESIEAQRDHNGNQVNIEKNEQNNIICPAGECKDGEGLRCCPRRRSIWEIIWEKFAASLGVSITIVIFVSITVIVVRVMCQAEVKYAIEETEERVWIEAEEFFTQAFLQQELPPKGVVPNALDLSGPCPDNQRGVCITAVQMRLAMRWARYYLNRGDAESALIAQARHMPNGIDIIDRQQQARDYYQRAIEIGSAVGSQAAIYAAKRIQYQSMTCIYDDTSLARISRDYDKNTLGALIDMKQKQGALKALGYYNGEIDGRHGGGTRDAIRDFQADLWFDQTGALSAEQTVLLICGGAQVAKHVGSQNVLGVMYATGLGVRQNTDFALNWLEMAARRGDGDASWNLAMLYGTKTVYSSVLVCDSVQNAERADSYLRDAASAGHPAAQRAVRKYPYDAPDKRWDKLRGDLNQPEALDRVGRGCNPNN